MKASKLIRKLQAKIDKHGDLHVRMKSIDGALDGKPGEIAIYSENGFCPNEDSAEGKFHFFLWPK